MDSNTFHFRGGTDVSTLDAQFWMGNFSTDGINLIQASSTYFGISIGGTAFLGGIAFTGE
jgi:hypothetical protein